MYSMENLLMLVSTERAVALKLQVGLPPVIVLENENHALEGPPITPEEVEELLRSIANTRHMRELRENGDVVFIYKFQGSSPFLVRAKLQNGYVGFEIL